MNLGHIYQLLSVLSFGLGNALWKIPQNQIGVFRLIFYRSALTSILFFSLAIFYFEFSGEWIDWLKAIGLYAISYWGLVFYNLAIRHSTVSQTVTVTSASSIFGVATSILVYNEPFKWTLVFSLLCVIVGLSFIEGSKPSFAKSKGTLYALLAAFFWGTTFALFRIPVEALGEIQFSFCLEITVCVSSLIMIILAKEKSTGQISLRNKSTVIILALLGFSGVLFYNAAVERALMTEITFIGTFTPIVSIVISHLILKEKFQLRHYLGMAFAIFGAFILLVI